jgi:hypothetical protein
MIGTAVDNAALYTDCAFGFLYIFPVVLHCIGVLGAQYWMPEEGVRSLRRFLYANTHCMMANPLSLGSDLRTEPKCE